jgi:VIT1/CCC1 family predicted Fe2+/Mn2+ transporter
MLGGIFTIAIADALSDALGMHLAEESSNKNHWQVWQATLATFATKFLLALSFAIPVLLLTERTAVIVGVIYGMLVLIGLNFYIAKMKKEKGWKIIGEHLLIVIAVIVISYLVGSWIGMYF